jgi:hypothetical protein
MSSRSIKVFLTVLLCLSTSLFAGTWTVDYLDGSLEVSRDGRWQEAAIGDRLEDSDQVRVGRATVAELSSAAGPATLSAPGVYKLSDLSQGPAATAGSSMRSIVAKRLSRLSGIRTGASTSDAAVMGVRGAAADKPTAVEWVAEDEEQFKKGRALMESGRYAEAALLFVDSARIAIGDDRAAAYYYAAYSYALQDRNAQALKCLAEVPVLERLPFYTELVLLKGRLLAASGSFAPSLDLLDAYLRAQPRGESAQEVLLLSALCLQGLKDPSAARSRLEEALALNPDSEAGHMAGLMLQELKN